MFNYNDLHGIREYGSFQYTRSVFFLSTQVGSIVVKDISRILYVLSLKADKVNTYDRLYHVSDKAFYLNFFSYRDMENILLKIYVELFEPKASKFAWRTTKCIFWDFQL